MRTGGALQHLCTPKPRHTFTFSETHLSLLPYFFGFHHHFLFVFSCVFRSDVEKVEVTESQKKDREIEKGGNRCGRRKSISITIPLPPPPYNFSLGSSYKPTIYLHYAPEIAICRFAGKK